MKRLRGDGEVPYPESHEEAKCIWSMCHPDPCASMAYASGDDGRGLYRLDVCVWLC